MAMSTKRKQRRKQIRDTRTSELETRFRKSIREMNAALRAYGRRTIQQSSSGVVFGPEPVSAAVSDETLEELLKSSHNLMQGSPSNSSGPLSTAAVLADYADLKRPRRKAKK